MAQLNDELLTTKEAAFPGTVDDGGGPCLAERGGLRTSEWR